MKILLSIKPSYAKAILDGSKTVEFRKVRVKRDVKQMLIYMTRTVKKVVGSADIVKIVEDRPRELWNKFGAVGGISEKDFFEYYKGVHIGYALVLKNVKPFTADELYTPVHVPQSFCYVD